MRASDGAGRRRGRRANPEGGGGGGGGGEGDGASEVFVSSSRAPMPNPRGFRATCRAGAARVPDIGPGARPGRTTVRRGCAASAMGRVGGGGEGGQGRAVGDAPGEGGAYGRASKSKSPPGGPEKKYDRDGAPPGGRRDCCSAGAWGLRPDATRQRARRRDAASRRGAAAAPRRPNAGRGEEVARTRRDADPARSASPARRSNPLRLRAKCRALAAGIARGRGTRGRGAPSAALDRFAGGFGRYVFEPRGCVVNVWRPRARAPSVDGRENRLALFPRPPQKASLHRGSRSIRPARDPLRPGSATDRVDRGKRRDVPSPRAPPPPLPVRRFTPRGALLSPSPLPRAPGRTHTARPRSCVCAFALARP